MISRSEVLQKSYHGRSRDSVSYRGRLYVCVASAMELLAMHKAIDHGQDASVVTGAKPEKFPRPTVGLDEPIEKWEELSSSWQQYKEEYCLSGKELTRQLVACCSPDLATSLSRVSGGSILS